MTSDTLARLSGQPVNDSTGQKVGSLRRVFFDQATAEPTWITVGARRFGDREAIAPLAGSKIGPDGLVLGVQSQLVHEAPTIEPDSDISADQADLVSRHYGAESAEAPPRPGTEADLTSFEEQLDVGTETVESTARLRKRVDTEPVAVDVPLRHERAHVEHLFAESGEIPETHQFGEDSAEIKLHDDQPTKAKRTVAVETVRLTPEPSTEQRRVTDEVRRERIEVEDDSAGSGSDKRRR